MDKKVRLAAVRISARDKAGVAAAPSRADLVSHSRAWTRVWSICGFAGGAIFLMVLPVGHSAALRSISFIMAFLAAVALWSAPDRRLRPVLAAFGAWFIAAGLSLMSTRDMTASLHSIENEIIRSLMVLGTFYVLTRRLASYRVWVVATAVGFAVLSAMVISSYFANGEWRPNHVPTLGDYATAAITVLPLFAGHFALKSEPWPVKLLLGAAVALTLAAGYLTMSRAFWLVLIVGMVVGISLYAWRMGRVRKRQIVAVSVASAVALGFAALVALQKDRSLLYLEDRSVIYSATVEKLAHNPITGTGYGYETDKPWYAARIPGWSIFHPHNIVLSYADQMGPLGVVALLMLFGGPAWVFWRVLGSPDQEARAAAICGLVLVACVVVKNNLDYFFWKHNLWLFFAHLGIYLGHIDRSLGSGADQVGLHARMT
jgi:O-antigen ligase